MQEIALIGFVQTIFYSILVFTKKNKEAKEYLLILFLIFVGMELIYRYLLNIVSDSQYTWLVLFDMSYWALFGPITLFYILFTTGQVTKFNLKHAIHLIPLVISFFAFKNFIFGQSIYNSFAEYFNNSSGIIMAGLYFWEFCSPVYLIYSIYVLIVHKNSLKNYFSETSGRDIKWLAFLLSGFLLTVITSYVIWILEDVFYIQIEFRIIEFLPAILTVYVFFMGYYGFKQTGRFFDLEELPQKKMNKVDIKYKKSGLDDEERARLIVELKKIMKTEQLYLDHDLNIGVLAKMLNTNFHRLSQVINESFQQNFYDFVNTYRIEESKRLLKDPESEKYKIISIAYDSGFSSKSSFYTAFKKNTGITPREYLNKVKSNSIPAV